MDQNPVFSKLFPHLNQMHSSNSGFPLLNLSPEAMQQLAMLMKNTGMKNEEKQLEEHLKAQEYAERVRAATRDATRDASLAKRISRHKKGGKFKRSATPSPPREPAAPITVSKKIVSSTMAPEGGKIVSSRDEKGQITMRVEYDREMVLQCARSPFALLPPASLRSIVSEMPEILSRFPVRRGIPSDDSIDF